MIGCGLARSDTEQSRDFRIWSPAFETSNTRWASQYKRDRNVVHAQSRRDLSTAGVVGVVHEDGDVLECRDLLTVMLHGANEAGFVLKTRFTAWNRKNQDHDTRFDEICHGTCLQLWPFTALRQVHAETLNLRASAAQDNPQSLA